MWKSANLNADTNVWESKMFLTEDRILYFELVTKPGSNWLLRYCKTASAETFVHQGIAAFSVQRRSWVNTDFFTTMYALVHFPKIWNTSTFDCKKAIVAY